MKRKFMLLLTCLFIGIGLVTAQVTKVTGTVISEEDGLPVVGASILVKGTAVGTVTDMDGKFQLPNVPSSAKTLVISFIGMATQEVAIKPNLNITLKPDTETLEEVIVTAYGTAKKSAFTGSASVTYWAVTLAAYGITGLWISTFSRTFPSFSPAPTNIPEWNGPLTFNIMARFAPAAFNFSQASSTAAFLPEITICPGQL